MKVIIRWLRRRWNRVLADTIAFGLFGFAVGAVTTILYEMVLFGFTFRQWIGIRIFFTILRFVFAFVCGWLTDFLRQHFPGAAHNRFWRAMAEATALTVYQMPLYVVSALIVGVDWHKIAFMSGIYLLENFLFGWLYGLILDWTRKKFAAYLARKRGE